MTKIKIGNSIIGEENPCFTIAEAGANHNALRVFDKSELEVLWLNEHIFEKK